MGATAVLPSQPGALEPASEVPPLTNTTSPSDATTSKGAPLLADAMVAAAGIAVPLTNETAQASTLAGAAIETNALLVNASRDATPSNLSVVAPREAPPLVVQ